MRKSLNLDQMFIPVPYSEVKFNLFKFPGGELHIKLSKVTLEDEVLITHRIRNSDDLMAILIAADALKRIGVKKIDLVIPYIPYARQDRYEIAGESFTLKVFSQIINSVNFNKVYAFDVHSIITPALIDNLSSVSNFSFIHQVITKEIKKEIWIVSPDVGANKKINSLVNFFSSSNVKIAGILKCDKIRNIHTGELSGFEVPNIDLGGQDYLIVDDICDGGGTFMCFMEFLVKDLKNYKYLTNFSLLILFKILIIL